MHTKPDALAYRWTSVWGQAAALVGVAALAITQPVLELLGQNPEFFIAGRYTREQIIQFALVVALVPSAVVVGVFLVARVAHRRAGDLVHGLLLAALGGLFGNVLVHGFGAESTGAAIGATVAGAALATVMARGRGGRLLLQYLAVANVLFVVSFLVMSPVSQLLAGAVDSDSLGTVTVPEPPGPVVFVVFDELPLATIVREDGTINAERYPAFARLGAGSTWYRNASSVHNRTERAVPALMTGTLLEARAMPTYQDLPRNLLSLMATTVPVERYEAVTDLCPPDACEARPGQPLSQALSDAAVVFGHRVLPQVLSSDLAPIDDAWGSFGGGVAAAAPVEDADAEEPSDDLFASDNPLARYRAFDDSERAPEVQAYRLIEQGLAIDATPALHFVHVVFPHAPWWDTPWGTRIMGPVPTWVEEEGLPGYEWSALGRYQRHSLQVGAADVALGEVIDHLEDAGLWDDTTIVVTADHGTSTIPPDLGRDATAANEDEVYRVPLFIKAAGQTAPEVSDDVALTIDALPTLMDLLDIETEWELDGHSLIDGSEATSEPLVTPDIEGLFRVVERHASDFPLGWDWAALAAIGDHAGLVGTPLEDLELGAPSDLSWEPANGAVRDPIPTAAGEAPQIVVGRLSGAARDATPAPMVIVANGTVAGVTGGYQPDGDRWVFDSMLGPYLVDGVNQIDVYEVTTDDGRSVLHLVG